METRIPHFIISEAAQSLCVAFATGGTITQVYSWFSFVINANIPFVMLVYMNYVIIKKVGQSRKMFMHKRTTDDHKERDQNHNRLNDRRQKTMKNTENQLTIMLLLVTTLFFNSYDSNLRPIFVILIYKKGYSGKICQSYVTLPLFL